MNKTEARKIFSEKRKSVSLENKLINDKKIFDNIINSHIINDFEKILCYVSVKDEPDTRILIDYLMKSGKTVYIPHCSASEMKFYQLNDINELIDGAFGIPTVDISSQKPLENFKKTICIVPALSFDSNGYRLGYGGGFYDRFLNNKEIFKLGISYEICLTDELPHDDFDIAVDALITENNIIRKL